jgi:hypothetical protein
MMRNGHAVRYPPGVGGVMGKFYNHLLDEGHVDSKLLGKALDGCPTLVDKVNFLNAILLQPPTDQQREWIEAFGLAWRWTGILYDSEYKIEVIRPGCEESSVDNDERTIN